MGSTDTLVEELLRKQQNPERDEVIAEARGGLYHDYDGPLETPKIALSRRLRQLGYLDLAKRCEAGAYDDADERGIMARMIKTDPRSARMWAAMEGAATFEEAFARGVRAAGLSAEEIARAAAEVGLTPRRGDS